MDLAQFITRLHIEQVDADLATFHPERKQPVGGAETFSGPGGKKATESVKIVTEDYGAVLLHRLGLHRPTPLPDLRRRRPRGPHLRGHRPERPRGEVGRRELVIEPKNRNQAETWPTDLT
jgi:hypothetical protein